MIDAATGLQERGHKVTIYTSHLDIGHCFDEARDGKLLIDLENKWLGRLNVKVLGNTIFPSNFLGRFTILCAILRQLHLSLSILFSSTPLPHDVLILDQLSSSIPLLRLRYPILFYCHFPDKLLARGREHWVKRLYRMPFDLFEEWTTDLADSIVVNSLFTQSVFKDAFPHIEQRPDVIYPCVDTNLKPQFPDDSNTLNSTLLSYLK